MLPFLTEEKVTKEEACRQIQEFVGKSKPFLVADVNQFDWIGICGLFGIWKIPFHYIPIDFASILFHKGIDPDINREKLAEELGYDISNFKKHHALHDAKMLKSLYDGLTGKPGYARHTDKDTLPYMVAGIF